MRYLHRYCLGQTEKSIVMVMYSGKRVDVKLTTTWARRHESAVLLEANFSFGGSALG